VIRKGCPFLFNPNILPKTPIMETDFKGILRARVNELPANDPDMYEGGRMNYEYAFKPKYKAPSIVQNLKSGYVIPVSYAIYYYDEIMKYGSADCKKNLEIALENKKCELQELELVSY
jgi:hypothetical protein